MKKDTRPALLSLSLAVLLNGCAAGHNSFDCGHTSQARCKPLHAIDRDVDAGERSKQTAKSEITSSRTKLGYPVSGVDHGQPLRYGEIVQRVWMAPYIDLNDVYHQPQVMYAVVKPAHWAGARTQTLRRSDWPADATAKTQGGQHD